MEPTVLLDLDGVIVDFVRGINKAHCKDEYIPNDWNYYTEWGMTQEEFFAPCDDPNFWVSLMLTPEATKILQQMSYYMTILCTSPCKKIGSVSGKIQWIRSVLPDYYDLGRYVITPAKEILATPNSILIDDSDNNVDKFRYYGGKAILFPRPWNRNKDGDYQSFLEEFLFVYNKLKNSLNYGYN